MHRIGNLLKNNT